VVDVAEPKARERTLERLIGVRKQRLERLERESRDARHAWRDARLALGHGKRRWRQARLDAEQHWQQARRQFFAMEIGSGQFRAAKGAFARLKRQAAQLLLEWREQLAACQSAGAAFFAALERLRQGRRQQEKLQLFSDEMRLLENRHDD
jgi:hypothetical protein